MKFIQNILFAITCASLISCGGDGVSGALSAVGIQTLTAGQSVTIARDDSYAVPAGTTVRAPNGNVINISGQDGTFTTPNGSVITVPATALGRSGNIVTGKN
jgi:predicted RecA/RadA family phage recombinase